jgi:hypothetical protein
MAWWPVDLNRILDSILEHLRAEHGLKALDALIHSEDGVRVTINLVCTNQAVAAPHGPSPGKHAARPRRSSAPPHAGRRRPRQPTREEE